MKKADPTQPRIPGRRGPLPGHGGAPRKEPTRNKVFRLTTSEIAALEAKMLTGETWIQAFRRWAGLPPRDSDSD